MKSLDEDLDEIGFNEVEIFDIKRAVIKWLVRNKFALDKRIISAYQKNCVSYEYDKLIEQVQGKIVSSKQKEAKP